LARVDLSRPCRLGEIHKRHLRDAAAAGQAGALAEAWPAPSITSVASWALLCSCASRRYDAAGPRPINFFQVNPCAIGGASGWSMTIRSPGITRCSFSFAGDTARASASVNYTLGKNTGDLWADNATQDHITGRCAIDRWMTDRRRSMSTRLPDVRNPRSAVRQRPSFQHYQPYSRRRGGRLDVRRDPHGTVALPSAFQRTFHGHRHR
jgi:hypothetical protein